LTVLGRGDFVAYAPDKRGKGHAVLGPAVAIDPFIALDEGL
jgi:hypothetical protein